MFIDDFDGSLAGVITDVAFEPFGTITGVELYIPVMGAAGRLIGSIEPGPGLDGFGTQGDAGAPNTAPSAIFVAITA